MTSSSVEQGCGTMVRKSNIPHRREARFLFREAVADTFYKVGFNLAGYPVWWAGGVAGVNDKTRSKKAGLFRLMGATEIAFGDKGYSGVDPRLLTPYPEVGSHGRKIHLSRQQIRYNRVMESIRTLVENGIHRIKLFRGLSRVSWPFSHQLHRCAVNFVLHACAAQLRRTPVYKKINLHLRSYMRREALVNNE